MRRLPEAAFGALAVATVGAFFITQHLKVTTPLIAGQTYGDTPHQIFPGSIPGDSACPTFTSVYFHLLHHADSVQVTIVNLSGRIVRTLAADLPAAIKQNLQFTWHYRQDSGQLAPPGLYNFRVRLLHQKRTIDPLVPNFPISISAPCPTA